MSADRKRQALGKGLGALIPGGEAAAEGGEMSFVPVADVFPNPDQPRRTFDPGALEELAASIREKGVLQPLLVHRVPGGYELVAGERRLRAARMAGLDRVPAVVRRIPSDERLELALVENLQRENLNCVEEAQGYRDLVQRFGHTQEEVAKRVGKERATVTNSLRLLSLPDFALEELAKGTISAGHGRALLALKEKAQVRPLLSRILAHGLSVREAERAAAAAGGRARKRTVRQPSVEQRDLERRLERALGSKVRVMAGPRGGRLEIHFASLEELDGIVVRILGAGR